MKTTTARTFLVAAAAIGLVAFTLFDAFTASAATPLAAGTLAIAALAMMTVNSYAPRRTLRPRVALPAVLAESNPAHRMPTLVRVPAVVEYPHHRSAARAA